MAEDHINTAFSALGGIDILLKRSVQVLAFWQRIDNFTDSVQTFKIRLEWERSMLISWAYEWGIEDKSHLQNRTFQNHASSIVHYVNHIDHIASELSNLDSEFPSLGTCNKPDDIESSARPHQQGSLMPTAACSGDRSGGANSSTMISRFAPERLKWALHEERLNRSLERLTSLVRGLYAFLPPPKSDQACPIVFGASLASQDATSLARISQVIDSAPVLSEMARIKSIAYSTVVPSAPRLDMSKLTLDPASNTRHFTGIYGGSKVFVEQKICNSSNSDSTWRAIMDARIENIVVRLKVSPKPTELRTLPCLGVTIHHSPTGNTIYNLVYRVDAPKLYSLRDTLGSKNAQRCKAHLLLGQRFRIAQTLARAVSYLHMADWLHKAIRSENILFFGNDITDLKNSLPYLVGFEYSRPDAPEQRTEEVVEDKESRYYRHPKAGEVSVAGPREPLGGVGTYSKAYDIYSIGVVLLEIGFFLPASQIVKYYFKDKDENQVSAEELQKKFIEEAVPQVAFSMGEEYAKATYACLKTLPDEVDAEFLSARFHKDVVQRLELCNP